MRSVGLRTLKNKLSEYVRIAAGGETVLISDRDRVVAELGPPQPTRAVSLPDAALAEAVRNGLIIPPLDRGATLPQPQPIAQLKEVLNGLAADRDDR